MEHVENNVYNFICNYKRYLKNIKGTEKIKLIKRKQTNGFFIDS